MEFDARTKEPDKVAWDCKVILPDGETVELKFRDYACLPGSISIDAMGNDETQLWTALTWGVIEPKHWPRDSESSILNLFRQLPMHVTLKIYTTWQKQSGVTLGESDASKPSVESTETS